MKFSRKYSRMRIIISRADAETSASSIMMYRRSNIICVLVTATYTDSERGRDVRAGTFECVRASV